MGNQAGSLKKHIETAEKTGALSFTDKGLEKFPPDLVKVVGNLRNLDLSNNKISSLPTNIGAFKMLKTLTLSKNKITSIPEDLGKLSKLENLYLSFNLLQTVPETLGQLKHLKEVYLTNNKLTRFPTSLCGLKQLNILDLSSNSIREVPEEVGRLDATELVLNQNQVSVLSPSIASCPRLKTLRLEENCLALNTIPPALLSDSGVSLLALDGNLFDVKNLDTVEGWSKYMERYTAVKRKLD
jgi:Leucine-rich repeat (LRR) protein